MEDYISEDVLNTGSEFLAHYGVKGMKWHQHKNENTTGGALIKGIANSYPQNAVRRRGRQAVLRGLSTNSKARNQYLKAERAGINHRQAKASLRLAKGYGKINKFFKTKPNAKNKKAANKYWRKNSDIFYESL